MLKAFTLGHGIIKCYILEVRNVLFDINKQIFEIN